MTKTSKHQSGFTAVEGLLIVLILVVIAAVGYMVYHNNHKKTDNSTTTASKTSAKTPITTKPKTVATINPYAGWKSYTLPQEKLSFKYPSSWSLVTYTNSPTEGDGVNLTGSNNATLTIDVGAGNAGWECPYGGCHILYANPVTFVGQKAYLDSFSDNGSNPVSQTELSMSASVVSNTQFFAARNVVAPAQDQSTATVAIGFNYGGSSQQNSNPEPLSYILNDQNYKEAMLIIESMSY